MCQKNRRYKSQRATSTEGVGSPFQPEMLRMRSTRLFKKTKQNKTQCPFKLRALKELYFAVFLLFSAAFRKNYYSDRSSKQLRVYVEVAKIQPSISLSKPSPHLTWNGPGLTPLQVSAPLSEECRSGSFRHVKPSHLPLDDSRN